VEMVEGIGHDPAGRRVPQHAGTVARVQVVLDALLEQAEPGLARAFGQGVQGQASSNLRRAPRVGIGPAEVWIPLTIAMEHTLQVIIEHDKDGYYAFVPELKGCHTQGDSLEEVMKR